MVIRFHRKKRNIKPPWTSAVHFRSPPFFINRKSDNGFVYALLSPTHPCPPIVASLTFAISDLKPPAVSAFSSSTPFNNSVIKKKYALLIRVILVLTLDSLKGQFLCTTIFWFFQIMSWLELYSVRGFNLISECIQLLQTI